MREHFWSAPSPSPPRTGPSGRWVHRHRGRVSDTDHRTVPSGHHVEWHRWRWPVWLPRIRGRCRRQVHLTPVRRHPDFDPVGHRLWLARRAREDEGCLPWRNGLRSADLFGRRALYGACRSRAARRRTSSPRHLALDVRDPWRRVTGPGNAPVAWTADRSPTPVSRCVRRARPRLQRPRSTCCCRGRAPS
jgi:hypothetical protein